MKYTQICLLFLMLVSYTSSGGQNKTNAYTSTHIPHRDRTPLPAISYKIERAIFGLQHLMVFFDTMENLLSI
jgi:hypothetical protein